MYPDSLLTLRWKKVDVFYKPVCETASNFCGLCNRLLCSPWLCSVPCSCSNISLTELVLRLYSLEQKESPVLE